jgi:RNA polymerase sigma-70 factor (ECF subfamily)
VNLSLSRDASHFDRVVRAYTSELFHFALWLTHDRHRAEDVLQEALARAWRSWNHVKDEAARRSWLYSIVRNEFYRSARDANRGEEFVDDDVLAQVADERDFTAGLDVRRALERLPHAALEPLVLQVVGGLSCDEIAVVLGTTVGATMTRISRARSALRALMDEPPATGVPAKRRNS